MTKLSEFRGTESKRLDESASALSIGDVTTVNLTILEGGVQSNVVPPLISVVYDIRIALDVNQDELEAKVYDANFVNVCNLRLLHLFK